ncbi:MAG: hypothetical protein QOK40_2096 [Miltoncostaeaceae bacterium]|nr:hypothetical protein [Miltoncostaeaceae bacterium]
MDHVSRRALRVAPLTLALAVTLAFSATAFAHARIGPGNALKGDVQDFVLVVPGEKPGLATTGVRLTVPEGFNLRVAGDAPGWTKKVTTAGTGEDVRITAVDWTGSQPAETTAVFSIIGSAADSGTYLLPVRQTYSDGSVVDWAGPAGSDEPSPVVKVRSDVGGGSSTLAVIALIVGALGVVLGGAALIARGRPVA